MNLLSIYLEVRDCLKGQSWLSDGLITKVKSRKGDSSKSLDRSVDCSRSFQKAQSAQASLGILPGLSVSQQFLLIFFGRKESSLPGRFQERFDCYLLPEIKASLQYRMYHLLEHTVISPPCQLRILISDHFRTSCFSTPF